MKALKKRGIKIVSLLLATGMSFAFTACEHQHSYSDKWSSDETSHWREPTCGDTNEPGDKGVHSFVHDVCTLCGYQKTHEHTFSNKWTHDKTYHWHEATCGDTDEVSGKEEHDLENNVCTVCGYDVTHEHTFSDKWSHDEDFHWHEATCDDTDEVSAKEAHTYTNGVCKVCGYKNPNAGSSDNPEDSKYGKSYTDGSFIYQEILNGPSIIGYAVSIGNTKNQTNLEIPSEYNGKSVREIAESGFMNCSALESITIPDSVTWIGDSAFYLCTSLTSIVIPNSVTKIGKWVFAECSALTQVTFSSQMTEIPNRTFGNCTSLESIVIPDNITAISEYAFYYCNGLKSITIGTGLKSTGKDAFSNCTALEGVYIQDLVAWCAIQFSTDSTYRNSTGKEEDDFYTTGQSNPLYYAENLYLKGERLTNLVLDEDAGVESVTGLAFVHLSVNNIKITSKVKTIAFLGFYECYAESLDLAPQGIEYSANADKKGIFMGSPYLKTVKIDIPIVGYSMFENCKALQTVELSSKVTTLSFKAFAGCTALKEIKYAGNESQWNSSVQKLGSYDSAWNYNAGKYTISFSEK